MQGFLPSPFFVMTALGAAVLWLWYGDIPDRKILRSVDRSESVTATQITVFDLPDGSNLQPDNLENMVQRPLFSETRKPAVFVSEPEFEEPFEGFIEEEVFESQPEVFVEEQPILDPPRFALQGFMSEEDGDRVLLRNLDDNSQTWVREGEIIQDWSVTNITPNEVHLAQGSLVFVVKLYD